MSDDASSSGTLLRTFIAIDLPNSILDVLAATQKQLQGLLAAQSQPSTFRWSPLKNLHLTLRFLGDTTPAQREQVTRRLQALATTSAPFSLCVDGSSQGLGGFPTLRQPRVLWMGLAGEVATLAHLQAQVEVIAQTAGFAPEERAFAPHLTLARAAHAADQRALRKAGQLLSEYAETILASATPPSTSATLSFDVDHLVYYQSDLNAGGSHYTVLAKLPLAGG